MANLLELYNKFKITNRSLFSRRRSLDAFEHMKSIVNERPLDINIETTNFCPIQCVFCPNRKIKRAKKFMEMGLFLKICREFYDMGGGAVGISSMQSDIFSDDLLLHRLQEIKKYKSVLYLYTTTNLVGASKYSDQELEWFLGQFAFLEISIGGLTRDDYKMMFGVDAFEVVKEQLFRIARMVKQKNIPIKLELCIRTNSINKLMKNALLDKLKQSYAITNVRSHFFTWGGLITQDDLPSGAKIKTVDNSFNQKNCVIPWTTLAVNVDGLVIGCGCVDWEARHIVGDMNTQNMKEVWNGKMANLFRNSFSNNMISDLCRNCSHYTELDKSLSNRSLLNYSPLQGLYNKQ